MIEVDSPVGLETIPYALQVISNGVCKPVVLFLKFFEIVPVECGGTGIELGPSIVNVCHMLIIYLYCWQTTVL